MARVTHERQIVETAKEARQGERGPSMLLVLTFGTIGAIILLAVLGYIVMT